MRYETGFETNLDGLQLRGAAVDDAEAMVLLTRQAIASRLGQTIPLILTEAEIDEVENTRKRLGESSTWSMLAEDAETGALLGLILGYPEDQEKFVEDVKDKEHLSLLMVGPDCQGKGIGGLLLDWCTTYLQSKGTQAVYLWTEKDNYLSRPIYDHKGWKLTGAERIHPKYKNLQVQYIFEFL